MIFNRHFLSFHDISGLEKGGFWCSVSSTHSKNYIMKMLLCFLMPKSLIALVTITVLTYSATKERVSKIMVSVIDLPTIDLFTYWVFSSFIDFIFKLPTENFIRISRIPCYFSLNAKKFGWNIFLKSSVLIKIFFLSLHFNIIFKSLSALGDDLTESTIKNLTSNPSQSHDKRNTG